MSSKQLKEKPLFAAFFTLPDPERRDDTLVLLRECCSLSLNCAAIYFKQKVAALVSTRLLKYLVSCSYKCSLGYHLQQQELVFTIQLCHPHGSTSNLTYKKKQ